MKERKGRERKRTKVKEFGAQSKRRGYNDGVGWKGKKEDECLIVWTKKINKYLKIK